MANPVTPDGTDTRYNYDIALIVTIPASTYEDALHEAKLLAAGIGDSEGLSISAVFDYERDNDGQRVLYLHNEDDEK